MSKRRQFTQKESEMTLTLNDKRSLISLAVATGNPDIVVDEEDLGFLDIECGTVKANTYIKSQRELINRLIGDTANIVQNLVEDHVRS